MLFIWPLVCWQLWLKMDKQRALIELQKLIGGESTLKLQLIQAQVDKINNDLKVDTSTEDKLKGYFTALRGELDVTE